MKSSILGQGTILIVDDQPANLDLLTAMLTKQGYQVRPAHDGAEALQAVQALSPDLILLDIMLPDMDGYEICRQLQAAESTRDIPVIFLSALDETTDKVKGFAAGGVDYVTKPFHVKEVLARVEAHLALQTMRRRLEDKNTQLERANAELAHEIAERKQAEVALRESEEQYRSLNETLEQRILNRTQALQAEVAERRRAEASLRALAARLAEVEETERRRLAGILHDQAGQNLTALSVNLRITRTQLPTVLDDPDLVEQLTTRLDDAHDLVEETTRRIRDVMYDLRPPALEEYGLMSALRWYGENFSKRTGIAVEVQGPESASRCPSLVETALFRIVQEALTNVARHAQATQATMKLEIAGDKVRVVIADDGIGFDPKILPPPDERPSWGLRMMAERAESLGGVFRVDSTPGKGTSVLVEVSR